MSDIEYGIRTGKITDNEENQVLDTDTSNIRQQIRMVDTTDPHLGVAPIKSGILSLGNAGPYHVKEELFSMDHNLGYIPRILSYFYTPTTLSSMPFFGRRGNYATGLAVVNPGPPWEEYIYVSANEKKLRVIHSFDNNFEISGFGDVNSQAHLLETIFVKYMIFSAPVDSKVNDAIEYIQ